MQSTERTQAENKSPLIIGHRGSSRIAPENTLASFRKAISEGADGLEFDVRLSCDGVPVVIHDATLNRTAGRAELVSSLTALELKEIDVGSWFNRRFPALAREEYANEKISTLQQMFAAMQNTHGLLYLEMKSEGAPSESLAAAIAEMIERYSFADRVIVESFTLGNLEIIKRLNSRIRTAALFEPKRQPVSIVLRLRMIRLALDIGADEIALHHSLINRRLMDRARESNLPVVVWTVDKADWISRARKLGIGTLITNRPAHLLRARELLTV